MNEGNTTFRRAQSNHETILQKRKIQDFGSTFLLLCHDAIDLYVSLLCQSAGCKSTDALAEKVLLLQNKGIDLGENSFADACIIDAAYHYTNTTCVELMHKVSAAYLSLRTAILEYMVDNCIMCYSDGKVTHTITGVQLEASEYSYKYTVEHFYQL